MDPAFFWSIFDPKTPKKRQKRAKFEKGKKEGPYGSIFDLTSISKPKILEFYHTLRKTRYIDVKGEIGPIKVRPYFDRPNPTGHPKSQFTKFSSKYDRIQLFLA